MKFIKYLLIDILLIIIGLCVVVLLYGTRSIEWFKIAIDFIEGKIILLEGLLNGFRGLLK